MLLTSVPYFCLMDKIDENPDDVYYKIGKSIVCFQKNVSAFEVGNYVRSWLVKVFYLSLMQPYMVEKIYWFLHLTWKSIGNTPVGWFYLANSICFFIF